MKAFAPTPSLREAWAWVLLLYLLLAALQVQGALIVDSGRDLASALAISEGAPWPAYGPSLFGVWQLGPVWYLLLGAGLGLTGSIGATALIVGLLAAAKVPLAWRLGRELDGPALGLAFAAASALPGWHTLGALVLSHTSLVESSVLATALASVIAWRHDRPAWAVLASLLLALALHAHPTAVIVAPLVVIAVARTLGTPRRAPLLALAAVAFALPFGPALWAEAQAGWPQLEASVTWATQADPRSRLARLWAVAMGLGPGQWVFVRDFLLPEAVRWPLATGLGLVWCAATVGLLRAAWDGASSALIGIAAYGGSVVFIVLLRDATPAWMLYACAPGAALCLSLGWLRVWRSSASTRAARVLSGVAVVVCAAVLAQRTEGVMRGTAQLPGAAIGDIAQPPQRELPVRFWLPTWGHDAALRELCREPSPVALSGDLATAIEFGQGVAAVLHCGPGQLRFGGAGARAWAGIPTAIAAQIGAQAPARRWGYVLWPVARTLHPNPGVIVRSTPGYRADEYRARASAPAQRLALHDSCRPGEWLVLTNLMPGLNEPLTVQAGMPGPGARTLASHYYRCPASGHFGLTLQAPSLEALQVFVLDTGGA